MRRKLKIKKKKRKLTPTTKKAQRKVIITKKRLITPTTSIFQPDNNNKTEEIEEIPNTTTISYEEDDEIEHKTEVDGIDDIDNIEKDDTDEDDTDEDDFNEEDDEYVDDENEDDEYVEEEEQTQHVPDYEPFFPELSETFESPILLLKTTVLTSTELKIKTITENKLRTYTFLVTRVSGNEQIVTSTTELKPHNKTIIVTDTLTKLTTLTLLDFDDSTTTTSSIKTITPTMTTNQMTITTFTDSYQHLNEPKDGVEERHFDEARNYLATRVMSNGVEVIVAGDKSTLPGEPDVKRVLPSTIFKPITLRPSTLSEHMMMLMPSDASKIKSITSSLYPNNKFVTKTCLTTFTYLTTYLESGTTTVSSHEQVVSNIATEERNTGKIIPTPSMGITLTQYPSLSVGIFYTTYTYLNTIVDGDQPLVITSKHTVTNTVTAPDDYLSLIQQSEKVSPQKDTNTYYSTIVLTKTIKDGENTKVVSKNEKLTQIVITESIPPKATSVMTSYIALDVEDPEPDVSLTTTKVLKTYFITYTYYNTLIDNGNTIIHTNVSTSADITTETLYLHPKSDDKDKITPENVVILATKTYQTTFTYFTTLLQEDNTATPTIINSHSKIVENIATETIHPKQLNENYWKLLKKELNDRDKIKETVVLNDGQKIEVTAFKKIKPTKVIPIEKTKVPSSIPSRLDVLEGSTTSDPNVVTGSTIIFFDDDEEDQTKPTPILNTKNKQKTTTINTEIIKKTQTLTSSSKLKKIKTQNVKTTLRPTKYKTENKKKPATKLTKPEAEDTNLLGLGSINIDSLKVLTPVINAMAGLIQTNLKNNNNNNKNDTKPIVQERPKPNEPEHEEIYINDTQNRSPIYIPVGDMEVAESQNIGYGIEWKGDKKIQHETPLINGGIPISPGEVITANSDVIVGKPGRILPRVPSIPLNHVTDEIWTKPSTKDDYIGPPPPASPLKYRSDKPKHIPIHLEDKKRWSGQQHIPLNQNYVAQKKYEEIYAPASLHHVVNPSKVLLPEVVERSTGQPLLVNIQPSQVAFVNIPHNRTTALIYGGSTEPHKNGQYFDDPSPYPFEYPINDNYIAHYTSKNINSNQKQVKGVIRVGPQPINVQPSDSPNKRIEINPSKPQDLVTSPNNQVNLQIPPISFGMFKQGNDFNAHIINHGNSDVSLQFQLPPIAYEIVKTKPKYQNTLVDYMTPPTLDKQEKYQTIKQNKNEINTDYDLMNSDGEVIQESNSRPLRPGEVPIELLKLKKIYRNDTNKLPYDNEINQFKAPVISDPRPFVIRPENYQTNQINNINKTQHIKDLLKEEFVKKQPITSNRFKDVINLTTNKIVHERPKVTSLPIDSHTEVPSYRPLYTQTEEPFNKINETNLIIMKPPAPTPFAFKKLVMKNLTDVIESPKPSENILPPPTPNRIISNEVLGMSPPPVTFKPLSSKPKIPPFLHLDRGKYKGTTQTTTTTIRPTYRTRRPYVPRRTIKTTTSTTTTIKPRRNQYNYNIINRQRVTTSNPNINLEIPQNNFVHPTNNYVHTLNNNDNIIHIGTNSYPTDSNNKIVHIGSNVNLSNKFVHANDNNVHTNENNYVHTTESIVHIGNNINPSNKVVHNTNNFVHQTDNNNKVVHIGSNVNLSNKFVHTNDNIVHPSNNFVHTTDNIVHIGNTSNKTKKYEETPKRHPEGFKLNVELSKLNIKPTSTHHNGNEVKIYDETPKLEDKYVPTRYITHTHTSTVTITKSTVIQSPGVPPSTLTLLVTKTEKSTIVDTVTQIHTLVKPTSIIETVTTTVQTGSLYPSDLYGSPYPSIQIRPTKTIIGEIVPSTINKLAEDLNEFIITDSDPISNESNDVQDNDTIFVVMTDKNHGNVVKIPPQIEETQNRDEMLNNKENDVLIAGVLSAHPPSIDIDTDKCEPECKASRNELCQKNGGIMRCICRPGFARMFPDRPCNPTYTYSIEIDLDRIGRRKLTYNDNLKNQNSSEYLRLAASTHEALDRMIMQSDLRDIYHGVRLNNFKPGKNGISNNFYLQLSDNTDEKRLGEVIKKYLRNNNFSLGGTELYTSKETPAYLKIEDFNECQNIKYHDCSDNAHCFNLKGTYTCSCKEGFSDLSKNVLFPGRVCSAEFMGCEKCNYHGTCYTRGDDHVICECFQWYSGETCYVNLKVLLIGLISLGFILFVLLLICCILTCCRKKPKPKINTGLSFFPQRIPHPADRTLDRRAMLPDTSSEDSRSETNSLPYVAKKTKRPKSVLKKTSLPQQPQRNREEKKLSTTTTNTHTLNQKDRSLTVMIPRAKYHPSPSVPNMSSYTTFDASKASTSMSKSQNNEAKLLSYLDAGPSPNKIDKRKYSSQISESYIDDDPISSRKTSGALVSAGFEVSATVGTMGTTCGTEADRSENATLIQKISADLLSCTGTRSQCNTLMNFENMSSDGRSYDETSIPPPMKSLRHDYDTKLSLRSHSHHHDEVAERDLGSTFLLPHTHLYKPDRGSDISGFESL